MSRYTSDPLKSPTMASANPSPTIGATAAKRKSLAASTAGNILEWYEWTAYAVFAPVIARVMFNSENEVSALLATFAVFAIGFLMRPLGGIVFGRIAARRGRKFVLITTMLLMAAGSFAIGIMPTYGAVGILASVLLLLARMLQGFAHGGESITANTYVAEISPQNRRGQWGSVVFVAILAGSVLAFVAGGIITNALTDEQVQGWGWRIPFLIGGLGAILVLFLRRGMEESEEFEKELGNPAQAPPAVTIADTSDAPSRRELRLGVLLVIALMSGIAAAHYTWTSYASTYAITVTGMESSNAYWMLVISQTIAVIALPLWGRLSDRIGRRPVMMIFAGGMFVVQLPLMALITDNPLTLLFTATVATVILAAAGSIIAATMSELFSTKVRAQAIGFAYSISVAVFGGSAPYLNAWLINDLGLRFAPGIYIMVLCAATFAAAWIMPEVKGIDLAKAGQALRNVRRKV